MRLEIREVFPLHLDFHISCHDQRHTPVKPLCPESISDLKWEVGHFEMLQQLMAFRQLELVAKHDGTWAWGCSWVVIHRMIEHDADWDDAQSMIGTKSVRCHKRD